MFARMNSKMFKLCLNAILFSLWITFFYALEESNYVKTKVYLEPESCEESKNNHLLTTNSGMIEIHCSLFCSQHPECRRFMVDKVTKECRLFKSGENCFSTNNTNKVCFRQTSLCSASRCTRCPMGYYGDRCQNIIEDCTHGFDLSLFPKENHLSYIRPNGDVVEARCDFKWGLTIIQNRQMSCNEVDFNRPWAEYASGFGKPHGDYWLGLQHIYDILQNHHSFVLAVKLGLDGNEYQSYYNNFNIENNINGFRYSSNRYSPGTSPTGDSMTKVGDLDIIGRKFSTYDNDFSGQNCANRFHGGWWYSPHVDCSLANLNGARNGPTFESTIHWSNDKGSRTDFDYVLMWIDRG